MKLTGQATVIQNSTYNNKKGDVVRIVVLGDKQTFEKLTFFNVPLAVEVPEVQTDVNYDVSVREFKNKQGFNQLAVYLNDVQAIVQ